MLPGLEHLSLPDHFLMNIYFLLYIIVMDEARKLHIVYPNSLLCIFDGLGKGWNVLNFGVILRERDIGL
jgi:hypothetical protein